MKKIYRRNKIALLAALASVLTTLNAEPSNTSEKSGGELTFDNTLRVMTYNACRGGTYQGQPLSQSAKMIRVGTGRHRWPAGDRRECPQAGKITGLESHRALPDAL